MRSKSRPFLNPGIQNQFKVWNLVSRRQF